MLVRMNDDAERHLIDQVVQRLSAKFPAVDAEVVTRVVLEKYRHFDAHPRRDFVPILVEDSARDTLRVMPSRTGARRG